MAEPPVLPGALQERSIWVVAVRPVGAPGAVVPVVALSTLEPAAWCGWC